MDEKFEKTRIMFGDEAINALQCSSVLIVGLGGVGGHCAEAIARSGIGKISLCDGDGISPSNINRQIIATTENIGKNKAEEFKKRISAINPSASVTVFPFFYGEDTEDKINISEYDYVIDCIDSVKDKINLICKAREADTKIISAMGAGNKINPAAFEVTDISKTTVCPLAKAVRAALRKRGITSLKVVYSREEPLKQKGGEIGSNSFTPGVMGMIIAGEVIKDIMGINK